MASGRKFGWKNAGAALGGGLVGAGVLLGLGKLGAPPMITSSIMGGAGIVAVGITRGPVQTAIASTIGSTTLVLLGSAMRKGRARVEEQEKPQKKNDGKAEREMVASKGNAKPRNNEIEAATVEAFDRMRVALAIDGEDRAAA